jgi:hypothetical protein
MSIESMAVVLHHSKAGGSEKLVLLGIANHDGDGGAWPSIATLARYANVEPRSVKKLITKLVERGEISKAIQAGGTMAMPDYTRPNLYHIKVVCPPECDRSAQHRLNRANPVSHRTPGVPQDTPPGVPQDTPPVSHRTPKPSLNHPKNSEKSSFGSTSPTDTGSICWNCTGPAAGKGRYCTGCASRGFNSPIIGCTDADCGMTARRSFPGQQHFDCGGH